MTIHTLRRPATLFSALLCGHLFTSIASADSPDAFSCPANGDPICNCAATDGWGAEVELNQTIDYSNTFGLNGSVASFNSDSEQDGEWSGVVQRNWGIVPAHATVTLDGKVLSFGVGVTTTSSGIGNRGSNNGEYKMTYHLYDPVTQTGRILNTQIQTDLFCAAAAIVPQTGQVLLTGGDTNYATADLSARRYGGIVQSNIYDPLTEEIDSDPYGNMKYARWYPTVMTQGDGTVLVLGGRDGSFQGVPTPEKYIPGEGYKELPGAYMEEMAGHSLADDYRLSLYWYPRAYPTSSGKAVIILPDNNNQGISIPYANPRSGIFLMDTSGDGSVTKLGDKPFVMGCAEPSIQIDADLYLFIDVEGKLWTLNMSTGRPRWSSVGSVPNRLAWSNMCLMPDGDVMISGGSEEDNRLTNVNFTTYMWDRTNNRVTAVAPQNEERLYHSTTLLLNDGTVLSCGGGGPGPVIQNNGELYRPAYLFDDNGDYIEDRFEITDYPTSARPGENFSVQIDSGVTVSRVTMVKNGSTTHAVNMETKFHEPAWSQSGRTITIDPEDNPNIVSPGGWMIFIFDQDGVPAIAKTVLIDVPFEYEIAGEDEAHFIETFNGDDKIAGGLGTDVLDGGFGNDEVNGGPHDDVVIGGVGYDIVSGNNNNDYLFGGALPIPEPIYYFRMDEQAGLFAAASGFNFSHENSYKLMLGDSNSWSNNTSHNGGAALDFEGGASGRGLQLSNSLSFGGALSISAYARFDDLEGGNWQRVFDFSRGISRDTLLLSQVRNTSSIAFHAFRGGNQIGVLVVADAIVEGKWAHWTTTIEEDGTMSLYKNGKLIGETSGNGVPNTRARTMIYVGDSPNSNDTTLEGAITDLAIFDESLTAAEVAIHFGQVQDGESLVAYQDGSDLISGGHGNDVIDGGAGHDELSGGNGDDTFVFSREKFGYDTITDWERGNNRIVFTVPNICYSDLTFTQEGEGVGIKVNGLEESYIAVEDMTIGDFFSSDFVFDTDFYDFSSMLDVDYFFDKESSVTNYPSLGLKHLFILNDGVGSNFGDETGSELTASIGAGIWDGSSGPDGSPAIELRGGTTAGIALDSLSIGGATTIAAYARFDSLAGSWQRIFDFSNGNGNNNVLLTQRISTDDIQFQIRHSNGSTTDLIVPDVIIAGEWAHWAVTVTETGQITLYKNGIIIGTKSGQPIEEVIRTVNYLGDSPWSNNSTLDGALSDVAIYDRALSATEVSAVIGRSRAAITSWDFNAISNGIANDSSGSYPMSLVNTRTFNDATSSGNSLRLVGNGYGIIPKEAFETINKEITLSFWVNGSAGHLPNNTTLLTANNAAGERVLNIHLPWRDSTVYWDAGNNGASYDRISKRATEAQFEARWNHYVFTKNANTGEMKIYLNGSLWVTGSSNTMSMSGISSVYLGSHNGSSNFYYGAIDDLKIYDVSLSDAEVEQLYNSY